MKELLPLVNAGISILSGFGFEFGRISWPKSLGAANSRETNVRSSTTEGQYLKIQGDFVMGSREGLDLNRA
jgi:hypothetical protein